MVAAPADAAVDQEARQDFRLDLAQKRFLYRANEVGGVDKAALQQDILDIISKEEMAPAYVAICEELGWDVDTVKLEALQKANQQRLEQLDATIKDAEENLGDVEVREARAAKADYLCKIGDRSAAVEAYKKVEETAAGSGLKMDNVFTMLRGDLAAGSWAEVKQGISRAKELCSAGGDWERKNRLKVYEAFFLMATRNFKAAATLFLEAIATFTTTELFSFERCIFYTVITSLVSLDRTTLKAKVVDAPEVLTIIDSMPELSQFLNSLYNCQYHEFFKAFVNVAADVQQDFVLAPHFRYYIREVRVVAYSQFLESYKSVKLGSMAAAFGVGPDFMDQELAGFIAAGRLPAKIDKVAGVVETSRLDLKNQQYQQAIKQGDLVLNRLQKLAKVADVE